MNQIDPGIVGKLRGMKNHRDGTPWNLKDALLLIAHSRVMTG